ncbi:hypothetical protein C8034_v011472 [Colletotrichum sidae]|uniref:Uncharacterized protein n=1 Tax=Colletotrichum sidae TaxID=1347389 RepID=A0A4R8TJ63_9PEZI|nr:hypothetical protein C8034_v011472 [Colletotrichum sidae]
MIDRECRGHNHTHNTASVWLFLALREHTRRSVPASRHSALAKHVRVPCCWSDSRGGGEQPRRTGEREGPRRQAVGDVLAPEGVRLGMSRR